MGHPSRLGLIDSQEPIERDHPLNSGLVAWWLGLDGNWGGSTLHDLCGKYPGTLTNGPAWSPGPHGFQGLTFDGSNDYVNCGTPSGLNGATRAYFSCWLWRSSTAMTAGLGGCGGSSDFGTNRFSCIWFTDGRLYFSAAQTTANGYSYATLGGTGWNHVTLVYDGTQATSATRAVLYVNGVSQSVTYASAVGTALGTVAPFWLGADASNRTCGGRCVDARLGLSAPSAADAYALYEQSPRGHPDTLRRYSTAAWFVPDAGGGGSAEGTLSATLAAPTLSAAGTVAVAGAAAPTLAAPTPTSAGTVAVVGTLSATLAAPTLTAAGTSGSVGTATITLAAPTSTAAGTVAVAGEATPTLTAPAPTAAGTVAVAGSATPALAVPTPTAAGTVSLSGSAGVTLALPALAAAGAVAVTAELAAALAGYTLSAAGTVADLSDLTATLAVTLDGPTLTAAGRGRRRAFDPAGDMALFDADRSMIDPSSDMDYFD